MPTDLAQDADLTLHTDLTKDTNLIWDTVWSFCAQSVVKPANDRIASQAGDTLRASEDRMRLDLGPGAALAAVSDGAGASGLLCGAWAQTLLDHLPPGPLADLAALDGWMAGFCDGFFRAHAARLDAHPTRRTKLIREGSCATLLAGWLDQTHNPDGPVRLNWLSYGDSVLLVFDLGAGPSDGAPGQWSLIECSPATLVAMAQDPFLLNWKDLPVAAGLRTGMMDLPDQAVVVLASDAVGQCILLSYLASPQGAHTPLAQQMRHLAQGGDSRLADLARAHLAAPADDFAQVWRDLAQALGSETNFTQWVAQRHRQGLTANDDSTVIMAHIVRTPRPQDQAADTQTEDYHDGISHFGGLQECDGQCQGSLQDPAVDPADR